MSKKNSWRKIWIVTIVFFFFILLIASFFGERGWIAISRFQKKKDALEKEIAELTRTKQKLEKEIENLKNNPEAVEKKARDKLWLMKQDELVVIKK